MRYANNGHNPETERDLALPRIERMQADPEPLRNLLDRVAPLRDLRDRVTLEIVCEIACAHHGLLASKLAKKASKKHGAIQASLTKNWNIISTCSRNRGWFTHLRAPTKIDQAMCSATRNMLLEH